MFLNNCFFKSEELFNSYIDDLMTIYPVNTTTINLVITSMKLRLNNIHMQYALFPSNIWVEIVATTNS